MRFMKTVDGQPVAKVAEHLGSDELHIWRMSYDRHQGRAPLRDLLAAYLRVSADDVHLVESEHGRPELAAGHASALRFNWSHSGDQAVLAVGMGTQPGIDIERLRPRPRALDIAQRYFDAAETQALEAIAEDVRGAAFLELWTAKEAVLKALGRGLAFGLHRLRIAMHSDRLHLRWLDDDDAQAWQLQRLSLDAAHVGSIAWRDGPRRLSYWTLADRD
jgi:4'-phosphopantetheinyl transferase